MWTKRWERKVSFGVTSSSHCTSCKTAVRSFSKSFIIIPHCLPSKGRPTGLLPHVCTEITWMNDVFNWPDVNVHVRVRLIVSKLHQLYCLVWPQLSYRAGGEDDCLVVPSILLFALSKTGCDVSPFPVWGLALPWLFNYHGEWLGDYISHFPHDSSMHLVRSHWLMYVWVPQVVLKLIFSYSERELTALVLAMKVWVLTDVWREISIASKKLMSTSASSMLFVATIPVSFIRGVGITWFFFCIETPSLLNMQI